MFKNWLKILNSKFELVVCELAGEVGYVFLSHISFSSEQTSEGDILLLLLFKNQNVS